VERALSSILRMIARAFAALRVRLRAPRSVTIRQESTSLSALAAGDVFEFRASLVLWWQATRLTNAELAEAAGHFDGTAHSLVGQLLGRKAHRFEPSDAFELEQEINQELAAEQFMFTYRRATVHCLAQTRVALDREIRDALRAPSLERMTMELQHGNAMRRADLVEERLQRWSKLLDALQSDPLAASAARLTEAELASVVSELTDQQAATLKDQLDALVTSVANGPPKAGTYEWAQVVDHTVAALNARLGPVRRLAEPSGQ